MTDKSKEERPLGIRTIGNESEPLDEGDETSYGVYWHDLRARRPWGAHAKRLIDIIASVILIVFSAPLFIILALLIRLTSEGPVVFRQRRIGFRCIEFDMYKFRTMVVGAEAMQAELESERDSQFFKMESDPRITPIGRLLRRTSLDELPQLFNVLEGTMSLVGPRPLLLSDLSRFPLRGQMRRFSVKPGITGLWQVSGRSLTSEEERMRLDREYVNRWSLWLDVRILFRTLWVVLTGRGAT
ncbi:MAG: sugar transferase [Acidobacteria bacterium]|nr:sugar transferase [Acidobacteriota bacterium]